MYVFSKADHVLSVLQTRKDTPQEAYERPERNLRHICRDLDQRAVEKDDTGDFGSGVGCRYCASLLDVDGGALQRTRGWWPPCVQ